MPFIYIPDIPQGGQQINNTTSPLQGNYEYIAELMKVNHVEFNTADIFGTHTIVNFVQQAADPSTGTADIALYAKSATGDNGIELFYRYPNNGVVNQLTGVGASSGVSGQGGGYFSINSASMLSSLSNGGFGYLVSGHWQYLNNGVLIMSGLVGNYYSTTKPSSPYTITIPSGMTDINGVVIPSFTQTPFNIQINPGNQSQYGTSANYAITATSATTASCYFSGTFNSAPSAITSVNVTFIGV